MRTSRVSAAWKKVSVCLVAVTLAGGLIQTPMMQTAQAVSGSTPIRVGLMMKTSSFNTTTDTVTLQGQGGLQAGFYTGGKFTARYSSNSAVKASLDNYYVLVGSYATLAEAQTAAGRIDDMGMSYDILVESLSGQKRYQLINGYYEYRTQADSARTKLAAIGAAKVRGYMRLTAGKQASQSAAEAKANDLRAKGHEAYPLVRKDGTWEVWVGNEASQAELDSVNAKLGGGYAKADFAPADYLMIKKSAYSGMEIPHFIQNSAKEESAFVPIGTPAVTKVMEKAREYRGAILVQGYNEKPHVINYVGLDQYLYGVLPQEMASGWPMEALKAQAVAARTYAVRKMGGNRWGVADISDDVWDQAYRGYTREAEDTNQAVNATMGQVLTKNGAYVETLYSSNHGGYSGDVAEIWGSQGIDYLKAVESPWDAESTRREPLTYRVQLPSGLIGWMRASGVTKDGTNAAGFATGVVNADAQAVRPVPNYYASTLANASKGMRVVILDEEIEYNTYNWQKGPFTPNEMMNMINENQASGYPTVTGPVYDLRVSKWGQGEHMLEVSANGKPITVTNADYYRYLFNDLWSTRATIEQQGTYTVQSASGIKSEYPNAKLQGKELHVVTASGTATTAVNGSNQSFVLLGAGGKSRVVTKNQSYIFHGNGWGHALGMSQWGAHGAAVNGYTYDKILKHYYQGVTLTEKQ
ncbi:SpoIID/LytB domain-containing protein [Tumebacillus avium]|nr:SpoIID/LytB domain-containing protein [Tumebacillus avium]